MFSLPVNAVHTLPATSAQSLGVFFYLFLPFCVIYIFLFTIFCCLILHSVFCHRLFYYTVLSIATNLEPPCSCNIWQSNDSPENVNVHYCTVTRGMFDGLSTRCFFVCTAHLQLDHRLSGQESLCAISGVFLLALYIVLYIEPTLNIYLARWAEHYFLLV